MGRVNAALRNKHHIAQPVNGRDIGRLLCDLYKGEQGQVNKEEEFPGPLFDNNIIIGLELTWRFTGYSMEDLGCDWHWARRAVGCHRN